MSASYPTKLILAMKSGNRCAMTGCQKKLVADGQKADPALIGEAAHIYGENPGTSKKAASARYKENMTDEERNHYDNLIYLCPSCHTLIDKQEADYPAEKLFDLKKTHENWVNEQLDKSMSEVTFTELEIAAKAIASGKHSSHGTLEILTPDAKIKKNGLGPESKSFITMGLSRSSEVSIFLSEMSKLDPDFPQRLQKGFKDKYLTLKQNFHGDELFLSMLDFAQKNLDSFKLKAAGLSLMTHLFQLCEIFEK